MPHKAPRICSCGRVVEGGTMCQCQRTRARERKARHDARRPQAQHRGYDAAWRKARAEFLAVNRTCRRCGAPATVVDHIEPHRGNQRLFWNRANWQPLCQPCHARWKQAQEKRTQ